MITFFKTVKEIRSRSGALHFKRFAIFEILNFCALYIHFIYKADEDKHLHNHPWNYIGLVLKGCYHELTPLGTFRKVPGCLYFGTRKLFHKILQVDIQPTITLFFTYGKYKDWGYKYDGPSSSLTPSRSFINNKEYRELKRANKL